VEQASGEYHNPSPDYFSHCFHSGSIPFCTDKNADAPEISRPKIVFQGMVALRRPSFQWRLDYA
jgi:hypothetical protein